MIEFFQIKMLTLGDFILCHLCFKITLKYFLMFLRGDNFLYVYWHVLNVLCLNLKNTFILSGRVYHSLPVQHNV